MNRTPREEPLGRHWTEVLPSLLAGLGRSASGSTGPRAVDERIAERAVAAWLRRRLPDGEGRRPLARSFEREIERRFETLREGLVRAVVAAGWDERICNDDCPERSGFIACLRERLRREHGPLRRFERTVGRSSATWQDFRRLIVAVHGLSEPGSAATDELIREVSLSLSFASSRRVPWFRR